MPSIGARGNDSSASRCKPAHDCAPHQAACRRHDEHGEQEDQHKQLYITVVPLRDA